MRFRILALSAIAIACSASVLAATPVNLRHESISLLQSMTKPVATATAGSKSAIKQTSSNVDVTGTTHIRFQQTFASYPVWGSESVAHVPHNTHATLANLSADSSMNGMIFKNLDADLSNAPALLFTKEQASKAFQYALGLFQKKSGNKTYDAAHTKTNLLVYVDKNQKAHWAYYITFIAKGAHGETAVPTYILDATTFATYEQWNDLQTLDVATGSGFGGNDKMGKSTYDGSSSAHPLLDIRRDASTHTCYLQNDTVTVRDDNHKTNWFGDADVAQFDCQKPDSSHSNAYWDGDLDQVNGGYSPANDALYIGKIIKDMYKKQYNTEVLTDWWGTVPHMLNMNVHARDQFGQVMDNAYFLSLTREMYFGDGLSLFYPLTSLGVGAHEVSHGFTAEHSNLTYQQQSGGLNESFSDMAAQAAEDYAYGKNNWQIGPEIFKGNQALRYMDDPTKDGKSIANMKSYTDSLNVHYTSGIFNKVFYDIATASNWTTKKAFEVMILANKSYWTANTTFAEAGCGVLKATQQLKYDTAGVKNAMQDVGVDISHC